MRCGLASRPQPDSSRLYAKMKVFKDVFTGDELCSDSYNQEAPMNDEDLKDGNLLSIFCFDCPPFRFDSHFSFVHLLFLVLFAVSGDARPQCRVFRVVEFARSEEDGGGVDASTETVVDVIDAFRLQETPFSKKEFGVYIKGYMQRVKALLEKEQPDRVDKFMSGAQALVKKILGSFDDFQFFLGESADCEAGVVFAYYKDGEDSPRLIYIRDGLKEEKY
eukprot:XP_028343991.1 translationally-controlled tumor protein homolog [Physeter catodon]